MMPTLGLLEAFDRHGALLARTPITRWPVTVGRGLACDLVLDDPFVAPEHLRIDRVAGAAHGIEVELLHTRNGARLGRKQHQDGERFDWPAGTAVELGRTHLTLRLADVPIAEEQALPRFPWRTLATTAALLALVLAAALLAAWLDAHDAGKYLKSLPGVLLIVLVVLGAWSGAWSAANKLFAGRLQFWRHVRIASAIYLAADAVQLASHFAAFAFSWELLARFAHLLPALVLAGGLYAHLRAILPRRRVGLAWMVVAAVALGVPAWLGAQWLSNMRLSNTLYMSSLFPPSLRAAPAVPVGEFLQDARALRGKLDRRLLDDGHADEDE